MDQNIQNVNILIELAEDFFFLEICSPWMELALHPFLGWNAWFIKLYNINVKVLYNQADMGFAAEAGLFFLGGKGAFRPKKGCNAPSTGYGFPRKKGHVMPVQQTKIVIQYKKQSFDNTYKLLIQMWLTMNCLRITH